MDEVQGPGDVAPPGEIFVRLLIRIDDAGAVACASLPEWLERVGIAPRDLSSDQVERALAAAREALSGPVAG